MPCRYGSLPQERLRVEFVEADFEIGFSLVDMVEGESLSDHPAEAQKALKVAEEVFVDIEHRLDALAPTESSHFLPLVGELRRAIDLAKSHAG